MLRIRGDRERSIAKSVGTALRLPEGHAQMREQRACLFFRPGRGHHRDVHAPNLVHLVEYDLREDHLLLQPEVVVAAAVEALGRYALEVPDPRERHVHQPVEELVHPRAAQRHLAADGHVLAQLEVRDGLLCPSDHGLLSRDRLQVPRREIQHLRVLFPLAHAHVDDDLLQTWNLKRIRVAPLLHHRGDHRGPEALAQPRRDIAADLGPLGRRSRLRRRRALPGLRLGPGLRRLPALRGLRHLRLVRLLRLSHGSYALSMCSPDFLATRTFLPSASIFTPVRVGLSLAGSTSMTLDRWIAPSRSMMPPCRSFCVGRWCFLIILIRSMRTRFFSGSTRSTLPRLPRSFPATTITVSPFLTCAMAIAVPKSPREREKRSS